MQGTIRGRILSRGQGFILVYRLAMDARTERVMMWLAENIQACLRIFRRAQHQWLVRDILHLPQGVFAVFVLWHTGPIRSIRLIRGRKREEFIGKDEQAINHLHFHTFCIKMAAARQKNK